MARILLPTLLCLAAIDPIEAGDVMKDANNISLDDPASWVGGGTPGGDDVAVWDATFNGNFLELAADAEWAGVRLDQASTTKINFAAAPATLAGLSLGADGISSTRTDSASNVVQFSADVTCTADQAWSGVAGAGAAISIGGAQRFDAVLRLNDTFLDLGGHTVTISDAEVSLSGPNPSDHSISNGTFILDNASLKISSSGRRYLGTDPAIAALTVPANLAIQVNAGSTLTPNNSAANEENLLWEAAVTLNGGVLEACGYQGYFAGSVESYANTIGGSIEVTAPSSIELSNLITLARDDETLHKISAPISGTTSVAIKNHSQPSAANLIVLSGNNSGFTGAIGIVGTAGIRTVRLAADAAGCATATWNIAGGNTLELAICSPVLGSLVGSGTLMAVQPGESTASVGGGTFQGTVTEDADATLHFRKVGATTFTLGGTADWSGDTLVDEGTLSLASATLADTSDVRIAAGAVLRLTHTGTDAVARLVIDDVEQAAGTWGAIGSTAEHVSASLDGTGLLEVIGPDPFHEWIGTFPALNSRADRAPDANPDGDVLDNFGEFAFCGDPADGAMAGRFFPSYDPQLRLVAAVRSGAVFHATGSELVSDPVDGIVYRVQAATDPADFPTLGVTETPGFTPAPELPALPAGCEYRSFDTGLGPADLPRQFIRALAEPAP